VAEVWIDPGIGFGKTVQHNLLLLRHLDRFVGTGWPVAVGTSRKSFLGALTKGPEGQVPPVEDRLEATVATTTWAVVRGVDMVRVHDVRAIRQAIELSGHLDPQPAERPAPAHRPASSERPAPAEAALCGDRR
jgi:dihydropteroate synthase